MSSFFFSLRYKLVFLLLSFGFILFLSFFFIYQTLDREQLLSGVLFDSLKNGHFQFQNVDDDLSKEVFNSYFKRLEPTKMLFTQNDILSFKKYETSLDDEFKTQRFHFYHVLYPFVKKRILLIQKKYQKILSAPVNLFEKSTLELETKKRSFALDDLTLDKRWIKYLRYRLILNYVVLLKESEIDKSGKKEKDTFSGELFYKKYLNITSKDLIPKLEEKSREKLLKTLDRYYTELLERTKNDYFVLFLNTFLDIFDPHTEYFPPQKKEDFEIAMTGKLEGIGALLENVDGFIKVVRIVPGSASWKQKELEAGDVILKVSQNRKEPVDIVGLPLDKVVNLIRGKAGTKVKLTVKKSNRSIKTIVITRDVVELEDSYAKSGVFKWDTSKKKVGYIRLNSFYRDFSNKKARNSSEDVKQELISLNKKGVEGVILDLRNNGGGALEDAVEMSGLFIKNGPIVQISGRDSLTNILFDRDKSIVYSGPLVILINSYSASASEILAAALQDYKRAIIVGDEKSFGKGSVQVLLNIDQKIPFLYKHFKPLGSLKLTTQKFYRVTGDSTQFKGVEPDIILPSILNYLDIGESFLENALSWSRVKGASFQLYEPYALVMYSVLQKLNQNSRKRVLESKYFSFIETYETEIASLNDNTFSLPLVMKHQNKIQIWNDALKKIQEDIEISNQVSYVLDEKSFLSEYKSIKLAKTKLKDRKEWLSSLSKDVQIIESMNILQDLQTFTSKGN